MQSWDRESNCCDAFLLDQDDADQSKPNLFMSTSILPNEFSILNPSSISTEPEPDELTACTSTDLSSSFYENPIELLLLLFD